MIKQFTIVLFVVAFGISCPGCVIYPHPTQEIKGTVVDGETKMPIAGGVVENQEDSGIACKTSSEGRFDLPASHVWRIFFFVAYIPPPWEATSLVIKAHGYHTAKQCIIAYTIPDLIHDHADVGPQNHCFQAIYQRDHPIVFDHPIELEKSAP